MEQLANLVELPFAMGVGQESIVTDAHEPAWHDVHHEATYELGGRKRKRPLSMLIPVVLVAEGDLTIIDG